MSFRHAIIIICLLAAVEGLAWWWMHPPLAGLNEPVLTWDPEGNVIPAAQDNGQKKDGDDKKITTLMPELAARFIPRLGCNDGSVVRVERDDGSSVFLASFEWDLRESGNVIEAFIHLPEECMGSIGFELVEKMPIRSFQVEGRTLSFDHTVFRDKSGVITHAFKSTWVSGSSTLIGDGVRGGMQQLRELRFKSALKRFRPAYARVVQGAIRGVVNPDDAWRMFEESAKDRLSFKNP